jgi:hypothetical protein
MKQTRLLLQKLNLIALVCVAFITISSAQCPTGTIGVTGANCGCISGCNLTSFGGPNCSPAVSGNCSGGELPMSVSISVPDGCTYTVSATMQNRAGGCSASGADGGDQMKVDISGGGKTFQTGSANATLTDSYTLLGPGTITVSGTANRADEIITYSTTSSGATCVNCTSVLPVELTAFTVSLENQAVTCDWWTETELNNDYFTVERSIDGVHFEYIGALKGAGNSFNPNHYKLYDYDPYLDIVSYYRLSQTDFDGSTRYQDIQSVKPPKINALILYPNPSNGTIQITGDLKTLLASKLYDVSGREIQLINTSVNGNILTVSSLPVGVYTFVYFNQEKTISERLIITP